jgi:hypothetical protein
MSCRTLPSFGVVCAVMAMTHTALADPPGDPAQAGGDQNVWNCNQSGEQVEFRTSSARLSPEARATLEPIAVWARHDPARSVRLRGMTDDSGSARDNAKLSARRAEAVKSYLTRLGVDPMRVTTVGHADDELKDDVDNRRAVSVVTCSVARLAQTVPPPEPGSWTSRPAPSPPPALPGRPASR